MEEQGLQVDDEAAEGPSLATFTFTNQGQTLSTMTTVLTWDIHFMSRGPVQQSPSCSKKKRTPPFKWPESESTEEGHLLGGTLSLFPQTVHELSQKKTGQKW